MTEKICPVCNQPFQVPATHPNKKYCSRDCSVIGRRTTKEEAAQERVNQFIDALPNLPIFDVLEGRLGGGTENRMTVTGARMWEGKRFLVIVTD